LLCSFCGMLFGLKEPTWRRLLFLSCYFIVPLLTVDCRPTNLQSASITMITRRVVKMIAIRTNSWATTKQSPFYWRNKGQPGFCSTKWLNYYSWLAIPSLVLLYTAYHAIQIVSQLWMPTLGFMTFVFKVVHLGIFVDEFLMMMCIVNSRRSHCCLINELFKLDWELQSKYKIIKIIK